jgi:hypothetical protein
MRGARMVHGRVLQYTSNNNIEVKRDRGLMITVDLIIQTCRTRGSLLCPLAIGDVLNGGRRSKTSAYGADSASSNHAVRASGRQCAPLIPET